MAPTQQLGVLTLGASAPIWAAVAVSACIVGAAYVAGNLTRSGATVAFAFGIATLSHSWGTGLFLIVWFAIASALSRVGAARKRARTAGMLEKGERRDGSQVLANGGVFCASAILLILADHVDMDRVRDSVTIAGVASLVAAGSDTWATELGTLAGTKPWSLRERRRVAVGASGAVTSVGTAAALAGAWLLAVIAGSLSVVPHDAVVIVAIAGFFGAFVDTVVGAWLQARRWCPACDVATEQHAHDCGTRTVLVAGSRALDNDAVNFICTSSGAALAMLLWWLRQP